MLRDMAKKTALKGTQKIEQAIHVVRGQRVMLDSDLAQHYAVRTAVLNQAVKRNPGRLPRVLLPRILPFA